VCADKIKMLSPSDDRKVARFCADCVFSSQPGMCLDCENYSRHTFVHVHCAALKGKCGNCPLTKCINNPKPEEKK
jgi:hypothetical protein